MEVLRSLSDWIAVLENRGTVPGTSLGTLLGCIQSYETSLAGEFRISPVIYGLMIGTNSVRTSVDDSVAFVSASCYRYQINLLTVWTVSTRSISSMYHCSLTCGRKSLIDRVAVLQTHSMGLPLLATLPVSRIVWMVYHSWSFDRFVHIPGLPGSR